MEEKKAVHGSSLRSLLGGRIINRFIFPASNISGFTLIELLVVMAMIGIVMGGAIVLLDPKGKLAKARDSDRKSDIRYIQSGLELYRSDVGTYPAPTSDSAANCSGISLASNCGGANQVTFLQSVPKDPSTSSNYYYCTSSAAPCSAPASGYAVFACIENSSDTDINIVSTSISGYSCSSGRFYRGINP